MSRPYVVSHRDDTVDTDALTRTLVEHGVFDAADDVFDALDAGQVPDSVPAQDLIEDLRRRYC